MKNLARNFTRIFLPPLVLLACALACPAQSNPPAGDKPPALVLGEWKEFAPAGGGFSILFPGTPQSTVQTLRLSPEHTADLHIHSLTNPTLECSVIYADYPIPVGDPAVARAVLDNGAKGAAASVNAELLSLTEIAHEGHPGRLLRERMPDGKILRAKMLLVGQRLYQIAFTTPREEGATAEGIRHYEETANKFLDSFKLVRAEASEQTSPEARQPGEVERYLAEHPNQVLMKRADGAGSDRMLEGTVISKPQPPYPAVAKAARVSGTVVVAIIVDEEGKVVAAQVQSGHPLLRVAALKAAREARFTPTQLDGKPVKVTGTITYNFNLQ